ncbi:ribbon-helix-helix domain-containing protein [Actinomyces sp. B33]|uniref:ribbon-helix-helix domain-containing protein n=1 Tax=Actinomyces sp. B33 TaxID=2942131 RepID=UPI002340CC76|nr:CopG family transcriptional regulator [Actinomyces sp. B33]MDC4232460.1 ribbon-helix-helix domain-containing protein [Actinomyces sp. B33]
MTAINDTTDYEALAERAERGDLKTVRRIYEGDGRPINLADVFMATGRPRMEEATARHTWKTRATDELDAALTERARQENLPKSALIRKAVIAYLATA